MGKTIKGLGDAMDDAMHRKEVIGYADALDRIARHSAKGEIAMSADIAATGMCMGVGETGRISTRSGPGKMGFVADAGSKDEGLNDGRGATTLASGAVGQTSVTGNDPRSKVFHELCPMEDAEVQMKLFRVLRVLAGSDAKEANDVLRLAVQAVERIAVMPDL